MGFHAFYISYCSVDLHKVEFQEVDLLEVPRCLEGARAGEPKGTAKVGIGSQRPRPVLLSVLRQKKGKKRRIFAYFFLILVLSSPPSHPSKPCFACPRPALRRSSRTGSQGGGGGTLLQRQDQMFWRARSVIFLYIIA